MCFCVGKRKSRKILINLKRPYEIAYLCQACDHKGTDMCCWFVVGEVELQEEGV